MNKSGWIKAAVLAFGAFVIDEAEIVLRAVNGEPHHIIYTVMGVAALLLAAGCAGAAFEEKELK